MLGKLEAFAEARGKTMVDLAIGWLASLPHVASVIAGATKPEQVEQNVAAGGWKLSADELAEPHKRSKFDPLRFELNEHLQVARLVASSSARLAWSS